MKLSKKNMVLVSFFLFSLFFGAGNLIFPPFLGQNAGAHTIPALLGFLITAVVMPVLGVVVVARFDGLDKLGQQVSPRFGLVFAVLIYLSIGPGLGIPRAASVPFEMAVAPYLPGSANVTAWRVGYSLVFFLIALWLCLNPGKLVNRIGQVLTPALLLLILVLFLCFLLWGKVSVAPATGSYGASPFLTGFAEGYNTMDTIAALNFGLVIATTLHSMGMTEKRDVLSATVRAGILAGSILAGVYILLSWMGMASSGVYALPENGAWTLRYIVHQIFGQSGAVLLAAIFTLACLTTCVGLINSISLYFAGLFPRVGYRGWVYGITGFSFLVCNLGLNTILQVSVPVLNAIYPVSIVLILLGLSHGLWRGRKPVYPVVVTATAAVSVAYALDTAGVFPEDVLGFLPLYDGGFGWLPVAAAALLLCLIFPASNKN